MVFGMNEEEVSQLFKEFVRIKNKRTRGITGSGLGLSIVQKIAELVRWAYPWLKANPIKEVNLE